MTRKRDPTLVSEDTKYLSFLVTVVSWRYVFHCYNVVDTSSVCIVKSIIKTRLKDLTVLYTVSSG